jgi:hypothetical protein
MPRFSLLWKLAAAVRTLPLAGSTYHRLGLAALSAGHDREADALFERAAMRYRAEVEVEALARVRAHQNIASYRAAGAMNPDQALEIERQLYRLRRIESLEPPFALLDAGRLLSVWSRGLSATPAPAHVRIVPLPRRRA